MIGNWLDIQNELKDIPGRDGVKRRREAYKPYFMRFGDNVVIEQNCIFYHPDKIILEDNCRINIDALIYGSGGVYIGRNVLIGPRFFLHSANHDISIGESAFFERSFKFAPVYIGDNSLISANVSILPGANIGGGSFVAASATVTAKKYLDGCYLQGIPAKYKFLQSNNSDDQEKKVDVAILVQNKEYVVGQSYEGLAKMLLESIGVVQCDVIKDKKKIAQYEDVLLLGDVSWMGNIELGETKVWKFVTANTKIDINTISEREGDTLDLPSKHQLTWVPSGSSQDDLEKDCEKCCYYSLKRIKKNTEIINSSNYFSWVLLFELLEQVELDLNFSTKLHDLIEQNSLDKEVIFTLSKKCVDFASNLNISELSKIYAHIDSDIGVKVLLNSPEIVITKSEFFNSGEKKHLLNLAIERATKANQLASYGLGAVIHKDSVVTELVWKRLKMEFYRPDEGAFLSALTLKSFCYEASLSAFLILYIRKQKQDFIPELSFISRIDLDWYGFFTTLGLKESRLEFDQVSLIDLDNYSISYSLLENWLKIVIPPDCPEKKQFELLPDNYSVVLNTIENLIFEAMRVIFRQSSKPLLKVKPWPHPYQQALSVRYDVDRPLTSLQVTNALDIQRKFLNSSCGSWFFLSKHADRDALNQRLLNSLQELAIHYDASSEYPFDTEGAGVTCHSSPDSDYWKGIKSVTHFMSRGFSYCEALSAQVTSPRKFYSNTTDGGSIYLLPIHFPLEASLSNKGLDYFYLLKEHFDQVIRSNGHIILGTHPDIDQSHLIELINNEDFSSYWKAPISEVVRRVEKTVCYGAIKCTSNTALSIELLSLNTISYLQVTVYHSNGIIENLDPIQLNKYIPRVINFKI